MDLSILISMKLEMALTLIIFILLFLKIDGRTGNQFVIRLTNLLLILTLGLCLIPDRTGQFFSGMFRTNPLLQFEKMVLLLATVIISLSSFEWLKNFKHTAEFYMLILSSLLGMFFMMSSDNLLMFYLGLELSSIPVAALCNFDLDKKISSEAAMKMILSSAFSSAILLFGISLIYGTTGSLDYYLVSQAIIGSPIQIMAFILIFSGFAFKLSVVPFHLWTADVYEGSPIAVTAFLSVVSKGAMAFVFITTLYGVFANLGMTWYYMLAFSAIITMITGNLFALRQNNLKRFFAFSSIAQVGYLLIGISGFVKSALSIGSVVYFILIYVFSNLAAFGVISVISALTGKETIEDYKGLYKSNPVLALLMALALFSLAGIPVVNLGPDVNQCGGAAVLNAGNTGSSFLWSNQSTSQTTTVSSSGTYIVTVTNGICSATGSVQVYINSVPVVNLGPNIRQCSGTVTLDAGNNNYSYLWSTSSDSNIIIVNSTATYYVTVTDPNSLCTASDSVLVTIDTLPVVNLGPDTTQCGGMITLFAGNAGSVYLWSDGSSADSLNVIATGTYRVTVTNSNGCTGTGSIFVTINPIPVVTLSLPANVCSTLPPFALTGGQPLGGIYYEADTGIVTFAPNQQGVGPHQITYVYTNVFGCSDSDSASIFVRPQPGITTTPLPYLCTTSAEVNLNQYFTPAGGFYSGVGVSSNFFYPNLAPAGMDTIVDVYTDNFGCKDTAAYPVNVHPPVHVTITSSVANFTICQNQSITFTSSGATDYQFYVNGVAQGAATTDSSFTTTTLTNHSEVFVIGSNPCSVDTSEPIMIDVIIPPVVYAGNDTTINLGQTVQLHGVATGTGSLVYQWTPGNGLNFVNVPNPTYSGSDSITFSFKATDTYGCADSASVSVYVFVPDNVQLPTVITPNGDGFNDVWKLNSKINLDGSTLVIFDRWGQEVYQTENYANNWSGTYKSTGQLLPDGTYYYVLKVPAQHNHVYEGPINIISGSK